MGRWGLTLMARSPSAPGGRTRPWSSMTCGGSRRGEPGRAGSSREPAGHPEPSAPVVAEHPARTWGTRRVEPGLEPACLAGVREAPRSWGQKNCDHPAAGAQEESGRPVAFEAWELGHQTHQKAPRPPPSTWSLSPSVQNGNVWLPCPRPSAPARRSGARRSPGGPASPPWSWTLCR